MKPSKSALLLEAAATLAQPFSWEDLVVRAWEKHSATFGLRGWAALYPDSNRVSACLYGSRGLIAQGRLELVAPKLYRLVPAHLVEVRRVS